MIIAGIDPGLSGAIAFLDARSGTVRDLMVAIIDMPVHQLTRGGKTKREIDIHRLAQIIQTHMPIGHAFVEQVGAMPGQGVSSVFSFGKSYGIILGVLAVLGVPMTMVAPRRWKTALAVPAAKDGARARASQLMPAAAHHWPLVKHDGRAEAALLALYGPRSLERIAA